MLILIDSLGDLNKIIQFDLSRVRRNFDKKIWSIFLIVLTKSVFISEPVSISSVRMKVIDNFEKDGVDLPR